MLKVNVVRSHIIKPFSANSPHLHRLNLSLVEQFIPIIYILRTLFYSSPHESKEDGDLDNYACKLKKTAVGNDGSAAYIECNDKGVEFKEAEVVEDLCELLNHPPVNESHKLLPTLIAAWVLHCPSNSRDRQSGWATRESMDAFMEKISEKTTGSVALKLYKGSLKGQSMERG
ncbi:hypothetical protein AMTRI_Chr07g80890 [Amborella trichopoda]